MHDINLKLYRCQFSSFYIGRNNEGEITYKVVGKKFECLNDIISFERFYGDYDEFWCKIVEDPNCNIWIAQLFALYVWKLCYKYLKYLEKNVCKCVHTNNV